MKRLKIALGAAVALTALAAAAQAEMTNLEVVFVKTDRNGDSSLSKAEVLQIAIEQFVIADTDGDGMLEKEEVGDLATDPEFSDNDANKDSALSIDEMVEEKLADFSTIDKDAPRERGF